MIASAVGPYAETINETNGLLCKNEDHWVGSLEDLYGSPERREELTAAGGEAVKAWDVLPHTKKIEAFYSSLVERR